MGHRHKKTVVPNKLFFVIAVVEPVSILTGFRFPVWDRSRPTTRSKKSNVCVVWADLGRFPVEQNSRLRLFGRFGEFSGRKK